MSRKAGHIVIPDERYALVEIDITGTERIITVCQLARREMQELVDEIHVKRPDLQFRIDPLPLLEV